MEPVVKPQEREDEKAMARREREGEVGVATGAGRGDTEGIHMTMAYRIGGIDRGTDHDTDLGTVRMIGIMSIVAQGIDHEAMRGEEITTGLLGGHGNEATRQIRIQNRGTRGIGIMTIEDEQTSQTNQSYHVGDPILSHCGQ